MWVSSHGRGWATPAALSILQVRLETNPPSAQGTIRVPSSHPGVCLGRTCSVCEDSASLGSWACARLLVTPATHRAWPQVCWGWSQQQQHKAFIGPVQCSHAVLVPYSFSNKLLQTRWLKNNRYLLSNSSGRPSTFGGPKSRCWQGSSLLGVLRELPQRPLIASGVTRHPGVPWLAGASLQSLPLPSHVLLYLSVQMSLFLNGQQWLD